MTVKKYIIVANILTFSLIGCNTESATDIFYETISKFDSIVKQLDSVTPGKGTFSHRADSIAAVSQSLIQHSDSIINLLKQQ